MEEGAVSGRGAQAEPTNNVWTQRTDRIQGSLQSCEPAIQARIAYRSHARVDD